MGESFGETWPVSQGRLSFLVHCSTLQSAQMLVFTSLENRVRLCNIGDHDMGTFSISTANGQAHYPPLAVNFCVGSEWKSRMEEKYCDDMG